MNLVNELTNIKVKLYEYNLHSRLYETRSRPKVEILFITKGRNFQNEMSRFSWCQVDIFIMKGRDLSAYNHFRTELSHTFCNPSPCNRHWFLINFIKIYISFQLIFFSWILDSLFTWVWSLWFMIGRNWLGQYLKNVWSTFDETGCESTSSWELTFYWIFHFNSLWFLRY